MQLGQCIVLLDRSLWGQNFVQYFTILKLPDVRKLEIRENGQQNSSCGTNG